MTVRLYFHTIRHLRPVQLYGRLTYRLLRPRPDLSPAPALRACTRAWVGGCERPAYMTGPARFRFLNEEHDIGARSDWNEPRRDKLWLYNLHYFEDMVAAGASARRAWHEPLVRRWIAENPPGEGAGWEPYPASRRIVNWIKWAMSGNRLPDPALHGLAVQSRYLSRRLETHLLGNHLLANAKALLFAGRFFSGAEADRWYGCGREILEEQLTEQVLADGGHIERSPMYHAIVIEDLLDIANLERCYGGGAPPSVTARISAMRRWLAAMCHPDGEIPFFNDAALGVAPARSEIEAYAERLGFSALPAANGDVHLVDSGYVRLERGPVVLFADVAPVGPDYQPGHAHADTLSFEFSIHGQRVLVNSGTSVYGTGPERQRQRGTAAHNTVTIDDADSSEVWRGFRVARRARVCEVSSASGPVARLSAAHDGYRRLPGRPLHRREWRLDERSLVVEDHIEGGGEHDVEVSYHVHPSVVVSVEAGGRFALHSAGGMPLLRLGLEGMEQCLLEPSSYHPQFGVAVPNRRIRGRYRGCLPARFRATLAW